MSFLDSRATLGRPLARWEVRNQWTSELLLRCSRGKNEEGKSRIDPCHSHSSDCPSEAWLAWWREGGPTLVCWSVCLCWEIGVTEQAKNIFWLPKWCQSSVCGPVTIWLISSTSTSNHVHFGMHPWETNGAWIIIGNRVGQRESSVTLDTQPIAVCYHPWLQQWAQPYLIGFNIWFFWIPYTFLPWLLCNESVEFLIGGLVEWLVWIWSIRIEEPRPHIH